MSREDEKRKAKIIDAKRNPDAITGQSGSHPIGTGLGAAAGGAATGAIAGALAGPVGAAVGAVVGGVAGGYAGKAMAEEMDPTVEAAYWQAHYLEREYVNSELEYDHYEPAYRYGYVSRSRFDHDDFAAVEKELAREWKSNRGQSTLDWDEARPAAEDAWKRINTEYGYKKPR